MPFVKSPLVPLFKGEITVLPLLKGGWGDFESHIAIICIFNFLKRYKALALEPHVGSSAKAPVAVDNRISGIKIADVTHPTSFSVLISATTERNNY